MSWTKRQILNDAFTEIGMANYLFDLEPEDLQGALNRLDSFIAQWEDEGIVTGYTVTDDPAAIALAGDSGIASGLVLPVIMNLAVQIAPSYGKQPSPLTLGKAHRGYAIALRTVPIPCKAVNTIVTPAGAGNRQVRYDDIYLTDETVEDDA